MFEMDNKDYKRKKVGRYYIIILVLALCVLCMPLFMCRETSDEDTPIHVPEGKSQSYSIESTTVTKEPIKRTFTIDKGDSIYGILSENGIPEEDIYEIIKATKGVFDISRILPGHEIDLIFAPVGGQLISLKYEISEFSRLIVTIMKDGIDVKQEDVDLILPSTYSGTLRKVDVIVKKGDSIYDILHALNISPYQIDIISRCAKKTFNLSGIKPDHALNIWITDTSPTRVGRLTYQIDDLTKLVIVPEDGKFKAEKHTIDMDVKYERAQGKIESSLYESGIQAGLAPEVVMELTDIFAWDINFFTDIRSGDEYTVLYEKYYIEDKFKGYGRVIAARFINQGRQHIAIYYNNGSGIKGYYNKDGRPIRKLFLKAPLNYRRISSGFSYHRMHPVYHVVRPHLGVDYSAPTGTPVVALGDGKVIYKGWCNGFGNQIRIKHRGRYYTYYGHLSRFARGMHVGKHVSQGQVIGYVGITGVATGPHLDFRVKHKNGFINPLRLKPVTGPALKGEALAEFKNISSKRFAMLDDYRFTIGMNVSN